MPAHTANFDPLLGKKVSGFPRSGSTEPATGIVYGYQYDPELCQQILMIRMKDGAVNYLLSTRIFKIHTTRSKGK